MPKYTEIIAWANRTSHSRRSWDRRLCLADAPLAGTQNAQSRSFADQYQIGPVGAPGGEHAREVVEDLVVDPLAIGAHDQETVPGCITIGRADKHERGRLTGSEPGTERL